jgi:hypothetical protein
VRIITTETTIIIAILVYRYHEITFTIDIKVMIIAATEYIMTLDSIHVDFIVFWSFGLESLHKRLGTQICVNLGVDSLSH